MTTEGVVVFERSATIHGIPVCFTERCWRYEVNDATVFNREWKCDKCGWSVWGPKCDDDAVVFHDDRCEGK